MSGLYSYTPLFDTPSLYASPSSSVCRMRECVRDVPSFFTSTSASASSQATPRHDFCPDSALLPLCPASFLTSLVVTFHLYFGIIPMTPLIVFRENGNKLEACPTPETKPAPVGCLL